jgi:hypothetical protein
MGQSWLRGNVRCRTQGGPSAPKHRRLPSAGHAFLLPARTGAKRHTGVEISLKIRRYAIFRPWYQGGRCRSKRARHQGSRVPVVGFAKFPLDPRGMPVWGHDAALKRFTALYEGTWRLDPEASDLKITMVADGVAQVYLPINFTIGAAGQPPHQTRFLMNQMLVMTPDGWRVSSILPIPAPTQ